MNAKLSFFSRGIHFLTLAIFCSCRRDSALQPWVKTSSPGHSICSHNCARHSVLSLVILECSKALSGGGAEWRMPAMFTTCTPASMIGLGNWGSEWRGALGTQSVSEQYSQVGSWKQAILLEESATLWGISATQCLRRKQQGSLNNIHSCPLVDLASAGCSSTRE